MAEHWERVGPPVYISVAAYLGLGKKPENKGGPRPQAGNTSVEGGDSLEDLLNQYQHTGGIIQ